MFTSDTVLTVLYIYYMQSVTVVFPNGNPISISERRRRRREEEENEVEEEKEEEENVL